MGQVKMIYLPHKKRKYVKTEVTICIDVGDLEKMLDLQ